MHWEWFCEKSTVSVDGEAMAQDRALLPERKPFVDADEALLRIAKYSI
jgi:hypothetical protein